MSGFAGIVSTDGAPPDRSLLERIASRLAFRGQDGTHISTQPGAGFCFTFLRTGPAPQSSTQPCSLDGRVWLLGDVRLDGRDDLRHQLEQFGESTPTDVTDEELILRAWRQWGDDAFAELLGDFSFTLWDADVRRLRCVRDLIGSRPFYYAYVDGHFHYSNTLEVLLLTPDVPSALDPRFIGDFLLQEESSDPAATVYQSIRRLPPGHKLDYVNGELRLRRYATLPIEEPLWLKRPEEYVERFQTLLEQAVRDRLPRGPSAIFMSGGLDSTSVAAIATKIAKNTRTSSVPRAYTMDCRPLFDDEEGYYASLAAQSLGIPIEILSGASCLPFQGWDDPGLRTPGPRNDPFLLLNQQQYQQVGAHARVAWSGYGGDDVLTGQAWPYLVFLFRRSRLGTIARNFGGYILKHGRIPPLRGGFRTRLHHWMGRTDPMNEYPQWLEPHFAEQYHLRERWLELQQPHESAHPLHPIGYAGLASESWSTVFEGEDAAWTGVPVELRAPLLDQRVLRYLLRVPPVPWCMRKYLLRQTMSELLPREVRLRPKTPLLGDSLEILVENGKWSPTPLPEPTASVGTFVNWERVNATLARSPCSTLWMNVRPVSLNHWLKGVEKQGRIR